MTELVIHLARPVVKGWKHHLMDARGEVLCGIFGSAWHLQSRNYLVRERTRLKDVPGWIRENKVCQHCARRALFLYRNPPLQLPLLGMGI